ncbi:hypothetical protein L2E82_13571 [Cichorium intybus]|uniref:Uncharacterized protein n=1 Tax=Cichorium intybus TaxID=13427 RepID=A0ACB9EY99_CICIN|nr:hypothetical protein L2E82_13571 [Cichorium intybus]
MKTLTEEAKKIGIESEKVDLASVEKTATKKKVRIAKKIVIEKVPKRVSVTSHRNDLEKVGSPNPNDNSPMEIQAFLPMEIEKPKFSLNDIREVENTKEFEVSDRETNVGSVENTDCCRDKTERSDLVTASVSDDQKLSIRFRWWTNFDPGHEQWSSSSTSICRKATVYTTAYHQIHHQIPNAPLAGPTENGVGLPSFGHSHYASGSFNAVGTNPRYFQCKFCKREGTVTMIPGRGSPLTFEFSEGGKHAPLMVFDCRGFEPLDFAFSSGWKAESIEGTKFEDIDLSGGDFSEYDEKGECPVMISNVTAMFKVVDSGNLTCLIRIKACLVENIM